MHNPLYIDAKRSPILHPIPAQYVVAFDKIDIIYQYLLKTNRCVLCQPSFESRQKCLNWDISAYFIKRES